MSLFIFNSDNFSVPQLRQEATKEKLEQQNLSKDIRINFQRPEGKKLMKNPSTLDNGTFHAWEDHISTCRMRGEV